MGARPGPGGVGGSGRTWGERSLCGWYQEPGETWRLPPAPGSRRPQPPAPAPGTGLGAVLPTHLLSGLQSLTCAVPYAWGALPPASRGSPPTHHFLGQPPSLLANPSAICPPAPLLSPAPFQVPTPSPVASGPAPPSWPRPRGPRALTVAALAPVVRGEAVVALGPRRALAALAEAGLVAPVVHGADLVAVTLWTDRRTACDQGDFLDLTTLPAGSPHPRPDGGWRLPVASRSRGKTVFPHVHSPLPLWPRRCVARASPFPSLGLSLCICNLSGH